MKFSAVGIIFSLALSLGYSRSVAQRAVKISGKITDAETGLPLVGASVMIEGTKKGTITDAGGVYFLSVADGQTYSIRFGHVGYITKVINDISPKADGTVDVLLERNTKSTMEAIIVTAPTARRQSIASLYAVQKNSSSISDGIPAEIIRRSPDKNTGEVLKRVSGASIQDNKFVVVRGLNERYNVSLLNNALLPSTEPDKRAFSFDIIPSSVVDNLVIYKSPTPDLPGDFSGGAIKISTKDFPSKYLSELSFGISFNNITTFQNFYKGFPDGSLDWLGYFDKSRTMPAGYYKYRGAEFINQSAEYKQTVTQQFPNTFGFEPAYRSAPNLGISYTGGNTRLLSRNRKFGYVFSLGYTEGRRVSERLREEFTFDKIPQYTYNTNNYDVRNNLTGLLNLSYSYGRSKISLRNFYNNDFVKTVGIRNGNNVSNQPDVFYYKSSISEAAQNGVFNSVLDGLHNLNKQWVIDWNGSFGVTYRQQPDQRILSFRSPDNDNTNYYLRLSNENSPDIRNAGRVYSFLTEYIYGANANLSKKFRLFDQDQTLKFGTSNYYRSRQVEVDALGYAALNFSGVTIPETKTTTFNTIFSPENITTYNLTVANIGTNSTDYEGRSLLTAGYAMLDNKFSDRIKLTWGLRVENYSQEITSRNKPKISLNNLDLLPSFLLTVGLNKKTNLRFAGSQAVNRPEFRELASYSVFDYDNYFNIIGNPNLQRSKNTNADIRYEWFPSGGEIVSASLFYKYFDYPIEQVNEGNDVLTYQNATHASVYGAELELRKKLDFFGGSFFEHLTIYANAAYMKGSVQFDSVSFNSPMQGQSPYLINGGLTYSSENDGFSVNLLYNRIGPRLRFRAVNGAALNIYERPRDLIDFQVAKKLVHDKLEIRLTVSDILAQPFSLYYKYDPNPKNTNYIASEDKLITSFRYGSTTTLSLKYNF